MVNAQTAFLLFSKGKPIFYEGTGTEPFWQLTGVGIKPPLQPLRFGLEPVGLQTEVVKGRIPSRQLPRPGCEPLPHVLIGPGVWPFAVAPEKSMLSGG